MLSWLRRARYVHDHPYFFVSSFGHIPNGLERHHANLNTLLQTSLTQVLGLPLTEDAYLKYSNELAFAYYRDVMVGRG